MKLNTKKIFQTTFFFWFALSVFTTATTQTPLELSPQQRQSGNAYIKVLEREHYLKPDISQTDPREFFETYIKALDNRKNVFTQQEVDAYIKRFSPTLVENFREGNIDAAYIIYNDFFAKIKKHIKDAQTKLDEKFYYNPNSEDTLLIDRKDIPWPNNQEEINQIWDRELRNAIIAKIVAYLTEEASDQEPLTKEDIRDKAYKGVKKTYDGLLRKFEEFNTHSVQETYLNSLSKLYDPHSSFLSPSSLEDFNIQLNSKLVGIGVTIREDEDRTCRILSIVPGGPAHKSGQFQKNDAITGVGEGKEGGIKDMRGVGVNNLVRHIRGKRGTTVRVQVARDKGKKTVVVPIVRDVVEIYNKLAKAKLYQVPSDKQTIPVGVITFNTFYNGASSDIIELIKKLKKSGAETLILDLRFNGGGSLEEAIRIIGLFIPKGIATIVRSQDNSYGIYSDENSLIAWRGPLMILTSKRSASASEITAGALQDYQRALVIGDPQTYGKGSVQSIRHIKRGSPSYGGIRMTIQKFYLPDGESTQAQGAKSDIVLPSPTPYLLEGEVRRTHTLDYDKIPSPWMLSFNDEAYTFIDSDLIEKFKGLSQSHIQGLPEWQLYRGNIDRIKTAKEQKSVILNLEKRIKTAKDIEAANQTFKEEMEKLSDLRFPSTEILVTAAQKRQEEAIEAFGEPEEDEEEDEKPLDVILRESVRLSAQWALDLKSSK